MSEDSNKGFEALKVEVEANGDVLSVTMERLRDAAGVARLGKHVCDNIHDKLLGEGLGHYPKNLLPDSTQVVRLYKLGTVVGELVTALENPGEQGDKRLREQTQSSAEDVIRQIRGLVCE